MAAISTGLRETLPKHLTTHQLTSSGCPPSFKLKQGNISIDRRACDYSNELAYDSIKNVIPDIVVMAQKQHHEKNDWEETASTLKNLGVKKVIIVGPVPQWYPSLPIVYGKKHTNNAVISSQHIDKRLFLSNKDLLGRSIENSNFVYIDLLNNICSKDQDTYACTVIYNNELLVYDDGHLTIEGSKYIAEKHIIPVINDLEGLTISSRDSYFY